MRVVAGVYGGRRLSAPKGDNTRPTADRVREALFSIIGSRIRSTRVLDLFAGSGLLGIEALSRGAGEVTFVERARPAMLVLRENLAALQPAPETLGSRAIPVAGEALRFLRGAAGESRQYDLVFLDPPYADAARLAPRLTELLPPVLAPGALVIAESDRRSPLDLDLHLHDERRYGDTLIRIHGHS